MRTRRLPLLPLAIAIVVLLLPPLAAVRALAVPGAYEGRVLDAVTGRPIADALVTVGSTVSRTDRDGMFRIAGEGGRLAVRAVGYRRAALPAEDLAGKPALLRLPPHTVNGACDA